MNMDLSDDERRLIEVIVAGEKAWSKVADLARAGHTLETIAALLLREILEKWDHPDDGETVTLAPLGVYLWTESLELAERPLTIHRLKREYGKVVKVCERERVNFWIEGAKPEKQRRKRRVEDYGMMAALVRDKEAEDEVVVDEVTEEPVELFAGLFNGTKVKGIKIKIDPKLKGAKGTGKGGAKQAKARRRAG